MLKYIGIGVVVTVVLQMLFHIFLSIFIAAREKIRDKATRDKEIEESIQQEMVEDERDRLIELKAMRAGFILAGVGFFASLLSLAIGQPPLVMLHILFFSFFAGSLAEGIMICRRS